MGIKINDHFELLSDDDNGYIVDDVLVRGGFTVVSSISDRDAIPVASRKIGMTVYVSNLREEYILEGGYTNSSWQNKVLTGIELPEYVKANDASFTGLCSFKQLERELNFPLMGITVSHNNDTDYDKLTIQLTSDDLAYIGEASVIRGQNSNATAIVIRVESDGVVIPSHSAPISDPSYRSNEFIQGERLIIEANAGLARLPEHVMTRYATEQLCVTRFGGKVYGQIDLHPIYNYTTTGTVTDIINHGALGLTEIKLNASETDHEYMANGMQVETPRGGVVDTVRLTRDLNGFFITTNAASAFLVGDVLKINNAVTMPVKASHAATKQYVDDHVDRVKIQINESYFANNGLTTDPLDGKSKVMYSFTIPDSIHSVRWPLVEIYHIEPHASDTGVDYVQASSAYRHVIREVNNEQDIIIQCWEQQPGTVQVVIH